MTANTTLAERYLAVWNETGAERRQKLMAEVFTEDVTYTDPLAEVSGHEGLDAAIAAVQGQFAGLTFTPGGPVDAHHHLARFTWHLVPHQAAAAVGDEPLVIGFDVAVLAEDGRIREVHGFLDKVPAAA